jgi:ankyrin repeat protein
MVKYLIEHGHADVRVKNDAGLTPLDLTSKNSNNHVVKYLVEYLSYS